MTENIEELLVEIERRISRNAVFDSNWSSGQKAVWAAVTKLHNLTILMEMILLEVDQRIASDDLGGLLRSINLLTAVSSSIRDCGRGLVDWVTEEAAKRKETKWESV